MLLRFCSARLVVLTLAGIALTAFARTATASDGVLEINQTCAVQTGCFAGDAPAFPVTITAPGSYRLTGNLSVGLAASDGITISTNGVSLDLGGFQIAGPVVCTGSGNALVCGAGNGRGIGADTAEHVAVVGGRVTGFGNIGVRLGDLGRVEQVDAYANGSAGIFVGEYSIVRASSANRNEGHGINASDGTVVEQCTAAGNDDDGIGVFRGSVIGNAARHNGGAGFWTRFSATTHNVSAGNEGSGIVATSGLISDNVSEGNGGDGISVTGSGTSIQRNSLRGNAGWGLTFNVGDSSSYRENTITGNTAGTVSGAGSVNMGSNSCDGATSCP